MKNQMSESLIVKTFYGLYRYFLSSYTCKTLIRINSWYKFSKTNRLVHHYLNKSSLLKFSVTYRIGSNLFSFIDRIWDKLYIWIVNISQTSTTVNVLTKFNSFQSKSIASCLFILFFSCSYSISSILLGSFSYFRAALVLLGFLISALLLTEKSSWISCFKYSLFRHVFSYIFD